MRRDWRASYDAFTQAGEDTALGTDDLDALAVAAWQLGRGKESVRVTERVFTQLARTDPPSAAMKAVELGLAWFTRGDLNIAQAWMNRARRLLDGTPVGPTNGYLAYLDALMVMEDAEALAVRVQTLRDICLRIDTPALTALCHVGRSAGRDRRGKNDRSVRPAGRGDVARTGRAGPARLGRRHLLRRAEPMPPPR